MEEVIPNEDETIAAKRSHRLTERILARGRERLFRPQEWWTSAVVEYAGLALVLGLNILLIIPEFGRLSINGQFSGPIIPTISRIVQVISGIRMRYAMQLTEIFFFLLTPLTWYFFIRFLTRRKLVALLSVLLASLPISLFAWPRIMGGFYVDDVPHVASIGLVPMALLGLFSFLRRGHLGNLLLAGCLSSIILLVSPFGFLTYLVFAFFGTFSEMLLGYGRLKVLRFLVVFVVAAALVSFWYNPSFTLWLVTGPMGKELRFALAHLVPVSLVVVPVLGTIGFLLFDRRPTLQPLFLASAWTIAFFLLVSVSGTGTLSLVASRFAPELGIALAFWLAVVAVLLLDQAVDSAPVSVRRLAQAPVVVALLFVLAVVLVWSYRPPAPTSAGFTRDAVEKGKLWLIRDDFDGPSLVSGYIISGAALLGLMGVSFTLMKPKGKARP